MKNRNYIVLICCLLLGLYACEDSKDNKEIGAPLSQLEGINDNWQLESIKQIDELAGDNEIDVTDILLGTTPAVITFNSTDFTFSTDKGTSKIYFPESGNWTFDNNEFPTQILVPVGGENLILDMITPVRPEVDRILEFKYVRPFGDCQSFEGERGAVAYQYRFVRQ